MYSQSTGYRFSPEESVEWLAQRMAKISISTYEELAEISGIDRGTIWRYFNHERRPRIDVIPILCEALQVSPETILIALGALDRK